MTKTRKLVPIAIGLACAAALLGAVTYQDLSLRSRAAMELRGRIESAADAIAAKLGQCLNVRFTFARALGAHIVSQNSSQNATPAVDTGRFADLMTRNHGVVEALLTFPAGPVLPRTANDTEIPEMLLRGLEAADGRAAFEQARTSLNPVVETSAGFADGLQRILGFFPIVDERAAGGGAPEYLGMAVIVMSLDGILAEAGAVTDERLKIAIRESRADGTARYLGARAAEIFASDPVSKTVRFPMGSWELAAVPRDGWNQASPALTIFRILGVLMAGLVGLSAYFLARQPAKLRLMVDSATRELRAQKDELTIAKSRLANAIDSIPEGFALYDVSGGLVTSNRRYDRSEPFETSPGPCEVERQDGTWRRVQRETTPTGDLVVVQTDITAHKRHERELTEAKERAEAASKAKSDFLAMMSHEIRTPLNAVLGMLATLEDSALDDSQRASVGVARKSGEKLLFLVNEVLDFSKIEAGKLEIKNEPFPLRPLVADTVSLFEAQCREKGLEIRGRVAADLPDHFKGDSGRLRQVLINLVSNAVKFTERGGVFIEVRCRAAETSGEKAVGVLDLGFEVRDTGIGIEAEARDEIFSAFFQKDASFSRRYGGTGLGLAIAKRLVEAMDGAIGFDSAPGFGSTFWFSVGLEAAEAPAVDGPGEAGGAVVPLPGPGPARPGVRILIAEDNLANQMVIKHFLDMGGYRSDVASNGLEAVHAARTRAYDLVLMDISMPEMDGITAAAEIRDLARTRDTEPIMVAVTAHALPRDRERFLAAGFDEVLVKPLRKHELFRALSKWLNVAPADPEARRSLN